MIIKLNGKSQDIGDCRDLSELIKKRDLSNKTLVIEYNLRIIPKESWSSVVINEKDNIEIVSFVGGGWYEWYIEDSREGNKK